VNRISYIVASVCRRRHLSSSLCNLMYCG